MAVASREWIWAPLGGIFALSGIMYLTTTIEATALHNFFTRSLTSRTTTAIIVLIYTLDDPGNTSDDQNVLIEDTALPYISESLASSLPNLFQRLDTRIQSIASIPSIF